MDYKKKYEELLARLQEAKENVYKTDERYCCVIDSIVPELKESEDERIRKALIRFHKSTIDIDGIKGEAILAWLKNQGEKGTNGNEREIPFATWSEADEEMLNQVIGDITKLAGPYVCYYKDVDWLKSLKDRVGCEVNCTTTKEWSEEDKKILDKVITNYESGYLPSVEKRDEIIEKLKSLRPQSTWKPSDEQIKVCKEVYADLLSAKGFDVGTINSELNRLEEQLKKLRGE